jgi:hypothetical protein
VLPEFVKLPFAPLAVASSTPHGPRRLFGSSFIPPIFSHIADTHHVNVNIPRYTGRETRENTTKGPQISGGQFDPERWTTGLRLEEVPTRQRDSCTLRPPYTTKEPFHLVDWLHRVNLAPCVTHRARCETSLNVPSHPFQRVKRTGYAANNYGGVRLGQSRQRSIVAGRQIPVTLGFQTRLDSAALARVSCFYRWIEELYRTLAACSSKPTRDNGCRRWFSGGVLEPPGERQRWLAARWMWCFWRIIFPLEWISAQLAVLAAVEFPLTAS